MTKRHYRLFLASPGDVATERDAVEEIVEGFNLRDEKGVHVIVNRWENLATPDAGRAQKIVFKNTDFEHTDIFVGIFWSRMGTPSGATDPDTGEEYLSGTMEEFKEAVRLMGTGQIKTGRLMLYFCERDISSKTDPDQLKKVQDFKKEVDQDKLALSRSFTSLDDFKLKLRVDLEEVWKTLELDSPSPTPDLSEIEKKERPTLFTSKLVDRVRQVNDFVFFFLTKVKAFPKRPHCYIIHGDEGEGHKILVDRLIQQKLKSYAEHTWGDDRGVVKHLVEVAWVEDKGSLEQRKTDLKMQLFSGLDPNYADTDYSAQALSTLRSVEKMSVVTIQHNIPVTKWDQHTAPLIRWYIDAYWSALRLDEDTPHFFIFLNIKYRGARQRSWRQRLFKKKMITKDQVLKELAQAFGAPLDRQRGVPLREQLNAFLQDRPDHPPCLILEELRPITYQHVIDWFGDNNIYERERRRKQKANAIFGLDDEAVKQMTKEEIEKLKMSMEIAVEKLEQFLEAYFNELERARTR